MKLKYTFWIFILLSLTSYGQNVGIGTSSPNALLDVSATNNGILIPRVALTGTGSVSPLTSPATSTMVYNTATAGSGATAVTPGYYYWSGTAWIRLIDNASIGGATIVSNTSSANTLSTTVNGITGTAVPIVNSISNTSSANTLSTTVNGVTGTGVNIINSNTLSLSGNTLTSTVNGVAPTQSLSGLSLSGDVTGTLAGSTVAQIQGKPVSATVPTAGQVLEYIGSTWTPTSPTLGTVTSIATTGPVTGGTITGSGTIGCATCATTTTGGALSGTSPVAVSAAGAISCATCLTTGTVSGLANPSTLIGMSVTNGSGTTAMYANAAPAINPAITPTWTGTHTFSNATYSALFTSGKVGIGTVTPGAMLSVAGTTTGYGAGSEMNNHIIRAGNHTATGSAITILHLPGAIGTLRIVARIPAGTGYTTEEYRVVNGGWNYLSQASLTQLFTVSRGSGVPGYAVAMADGGGGSLNITITASSGSLIYWSFEGVTENLTVTEQ